MQNTQSKSWLDRAVEQKAKNCTVSLAWSRILDLKKPSVFDQIGLIDKATLN